jgi:hypothetical protein
MATQLLQVNVLLLTYLWVFPRSAWLYKVRSECQSDSQTLGACSCHSDVQHNL